MRVQTRKRDLFKLRKHVTGPAAGKYVAMIGGYPITFWWEGPLWAFQPAYSKTRSATLTRTLLEAVRTAKEEVLCVTYHVSLTH